MFAKNIQNLTNQFRCYENKNLNENPTSSKDETSGSILQQLFSCSKGKRQVTCISGETSVPFTIRYHKKMLLIFNEQIDISITCFNCHL